MRPTLFLPVLVLCLACSGSPGASAPAAASIVSPLDGDTVGPGFLVRFAVQGAQSVPADGSRREGEGHHHLFVDTDPTPADSVIPKLDSVFHVGTGADTLRLDGLLPGRHRLIAVFAYGDHTPVAAVARDTAWIVVR